jgi:hypothetical protein
MSDSKSQSMLLNVSMLSMPAAIRLSIFYTVLWITDRHPGPTHPDQYPFQPTVTIFFPENFNILSKIFKVMTPMTLKEKRKNTDWHRSEHK